MNTLIVQPGRYGDILICLPIAYYLHTCGHHIRWAVADEFADIFSAVSYVEPVLWHGDYMDGPGAAKLAKPGESVMMLRCDGRGRGPLTGHFDTDMWSRAGLLDKWDDLPLVLDRRHTEQEIALFAVKAPSVPYVLFHGGGHSSPFHAAAGLLAALRREYTVVDATDIKATCIVDMLGLIEGAAVVVTGDTFLLHMTHATGTPTVGLVADSPSPWHGSTRRRHWLDRIPYGEVTAERVLSVIPPCARVANDSA